MTVTTHPTPLKNLGAAKTEGETAASTLSEMQNAFQRAIMDGDETILSSILDNSRTDRGVLFGVYRHAYVSRLVDIIRNDHPLLHLYLGDEAFLNIAEAYVAARPSRTQNARWFSHDLPDFIAETESEFPEVAELAALERAISDAFDAVDAPVLAIADIATVAPEDWVNMTFAPQPSARRLNLSTNAYAIWAALKDNGEPPPAAALAQPERVIAWRNDLKPLMRRMGDEEAMMWDEASKSVPFGVLCELVAIFDDPDTAAVRAAQHLQGWIAGGLLSKGDDGLKARQATVEMPASGRKNPK